MADNFKFNPRFTHEWGLRKRFRLWERIRNVTPIVANDNDKTCAFTDAYFFGRALSKKGFVKLGGGAFSCVYGKPGSDKVIKVIRNMNDGWIDYVKWANDNGFAGNLAPKVYHFKEIKKAKEPFAIASMERLSATAREMEDNHDLKVVPSLFRLAVENNNENAKALLDLVQPSLSAFGERFKQQFEKTKSSNNYYGRHGFDLHEGNFMLRGDKEIVITDPVCHKRTTTFKELKFA